MAEIRTYRVTDRDYPWRLRDLAHPPDPLVVRGEWEGGPAVAVVGTRRPAPEACAYARDLARRLSRAGAIIWSGGAIGIDAAAHGGALDAEGRTVVVTGTGIDKCYPEEHRGLYEKIVETGGAIVSAFERSQGPCPWTFLSRNCVLGALVDALVVVQAPMQSGARSAAASARGCGRPVFVVPAYPWDFLGEGNLDEVRRGARPLADEKILADYLAIRLEPRPRPEAPPDAERRRRKSPRCDQADGPEPDDEGAFSPACRAVLDVVDVTPRHYDEISEKSGLSPTVLQEALLTLTLVAVLVEGPSGSYRLVKARNH